MNYHFENLTPTDFEHLIADLLEVRLNAKFERFKAGADGGIDVRGTVNGKTVVVQAKRYFKSSFSNLEVAAKKEAKLWKGRKKPDEYWFVTSLGLTPGNKSSILETFKEMPLRAENIISGDDLRTWLREAPQVARAHMKLWLGETEMLDRFLKSAIYEQSGFEVEQVLGAAKTFVAHKGVPEGLNIINDTGSLLITGAPGIGKTTMARLVLLDHIENGWTPIIVRDAKEAIEAIKVGEKRLIYFDDFLGSIALDDNVIRHSDHRINGLIERANKDQNVRFLMTSRDYILSDAFNRTDRFGREVFKKFEFVLQLPNYSRHQKAEILYNHLYFSDTPKEIIEELVNRKFYDVVIDHKNFNPRLISTMAKLANSYDSPKQFLFHFFDALKNPKILWKIPYESHFHKSDQLLVLSLQLLRRLYFFGLSEATLESAYQGFQKYNLILEFEIPSTDLKVSFEQALKRMDGGMIRISNQKISFHNPGVQEFIIDRIKNDGHLRKLISKSETVSELEKWSSSPYLANSLDGHDLVFVEKVNQLLESQTMSASIVRMIIRVSQQYINTYGKNHFISIWDAFANLASEVSDHEDIKDILDWLASKNSALSEELTTKVQHKLESDCEEILESYHRQYDGKLDEAGWYADAIGGNANATDRMVDIGLEMATDAMEHTVQTWTVEDSSESESLIETIDNIGYAYGISVNEYTDEIQPWEPDYDDEEYGSRISGGSGVAASSEGHSPSESDLIHDMFIGLKE